MKMGIRIKDRLRIRFQKKQCLDFKRLGLRKSPSSFAHNGKLNIKDTIGGVKWVQQCAGKRKDSDEKRSETMGQSQPWKIEGSPGAGCSTTLQ